MKTKEQIQKYNKEYCSRPEVIARAKERNKLYREQRKIYKKSATGRQKENEYRRRKYAKVGFDRHLWQRYKITKDEYDMIFALQEGKCDICKEESDKKLHVDHCHDTQIVRGLLCGSCNRAIGLLKDNIETMQNAIKYLSK
jgi:predicted metal-binding protein